jgi:hypothetical protein
MKDVVLLAVSYGINFRFGLSANAEKGHTEPSGHHALDPVFLLAAINNRNVDSQILTLPGNVILELAIDAQKVRFLTSVVHRDHLLCVKCMGDRESNAEALGPVTLHCSAARRKFEYSLTARKYRI